MGRMFRRRRPGLRLAAGAATAGVAYRAGKRHSEEEESAAAQEAPYPSEAPPPAPAGSSSVDDLNKLAELHSSGALSDEEFAQAKASLLGMDAP